ncbi:sensory neuron membrane protein 1-like [Anoplolepis gracilipes]|uniref:sensory neuron membrane protein 1-like n=1 Tax=Anoplolepis gracilipes TaxID=354296 RepID=UPI003BA23258
MMSIKKLGIGGVIMFIFGIVTWCGFPSLLKWQIKKAIALKPGNMIRDLWTTFPMPLEFKIYMFNVTNPDEIEQGQKPKVQEVGPFFYDEYRLKVDLVDREIEDTVEYSMKNTWFFNSKKSNGLTGNEDVVLPNLMILTMAMMTMKEKPAAIPFVSKAVDSIFHKPDSLFIKIKAKDIISDGLPIDCTVTDFAGSMVCNLLKTEAKNLMSDGENRYKFSLLGVKNATVMPGRMKVLRGIKNYKDVGRVVEWDGQTILDVWPEEHCNAFNGTDATIFPPLLGPDDNIVSFGYEICRSFSGHYSHQTKVKGINTYRYTADLGDMSKNPMEKCFCPTPDTCLTKNLYDMTKCLRIPIIGSPPHFYDCEKNWLDLVEGLHPSQEDHEMIMVDVERTTSVPVRAYVRLQFNMFIQPIAKFKLMKNFPEALMPLFWVEEGLILNDEFMNIVKLLVLGIAVVNFLKWLMIFGGIGMCVAAGALYYMNSENSDKLDVIKITPKNNSNNMKKSLPSAMKISTIQVASMPINLDKN